MPDLRLYMVIWNVIGNCEVFTQLERKVRHLSDFLWYLIFFLRENVSIATNMQCN